MKPQAAAIKPPQEAIASSTSASAATAPTTIGIVADAAAGAKANPAKGVAIVKRTAKQGKALDKKFVAKHGAHGLSCF